jgi:DAN domain.
MRSLRILSAITLLFAHALSGEAKSQKGRCFLIQRVQSVVPESCDKQNIKIPICFGYCPTSDPLFINGVDITRSVDSPTASCSCCRPVSYTKIKVNVLCHRRTPLQKRKEVTLNVPTKCECETTCSIQTEHDREKLRMVQKDHLTGPDGMTHSKKALYNILGKA